MPPKKGKLVARDACIKPVAVAKTWKRLEKWLKRHLPVGLNSLCSGLGERPIAAFEDAIGQKLPADFRESLAIHDGQQREPDVGIVFGLRLLSLHEGCLEEWRFYEGQLKSIAAGQFKNDCYPEGAVGTDILNKGWVPVAADWGGNFLAIDLAPRDNGTRGQVINFGRDERCHCVLARSWGHFLEDVADELEQGNFQTGEEDGFITFSIKYPMAAHFLNLSMPWSKAKLGIAKMNKNELALWGRMGKFQGWASVVE
jgi:cell wall assembly regulator SMI1